MAFEAKLRVYGLVRAAHEAASCGHSSMKISVKSKHFAPIFAAHGLKQGGKAILHAWENSHISLSS